MCLTEPLHILPPSLYEEMDLCVLDIMRTASKVMSHILLCLPTTSEADFGGMAVECEVSHKYSITFCSSVTYVSKGAV